MMRWLWSGLVLASLAAAWAVGGAELPLITGEVLTGEPISYTAQGVVLKNPDGSFAPRVGWTNFTENALKTLASDPKAKPFVDPLLEVLQDIPARKAAAQPKFKPGPRLERPPSKTGLGVMFSSPLSLVLLLLVYAANLYAAYEVSLFRNYAAALVCGLAAVLPVIGPITFLSLHTRLRPGETEEVGPEVFEESEAAPTLQVDSGASEPVAAAPAETATRTLPPATIYQRGSTSFNRRFFETKLSGFMRVVPGEAEKDMVICIRTNNRGEHVGNRIIRIMPNELYLQVQKGGATSDVIISFAEITELRIRHKDAK